MDALPLYVRDGGTTPRESFVGAALSALEAAGSGGFLSVRPRRLDAASEREARALEAAARAHGVHLLLQDDAERALDLDWDGAELPLKGRTVPVARALLGPERVIALRIDPHVPAAPRMISLGDVVLWPAEGAVLTVSWPLRLARANASASRREVGLVELADVPQLAAAHARRRSSSNEERA